MTKRIKQTAAGKLLHRKAHRGHMFINKQTKLKRTYVQEFEIAKGDEKNVKRMIGSK
jgi:large subunit ribosomal protein L35